MSRGLERSDKNEDKNGSVDVTQRCQSIVSCVVRRLIFGPGVPGLWCLAKDGVEAVVRLLLFRFCFFGFLRVLVRLGGLCGFLLVIAGFGFGHRRAHAA